MTERKVRIAITGGIGSGKSFVCQRLVDRGVEVFNCDDVAKRLMREQRSLQQRLIALVGDDLYHDGVLNKGAMARFILASEDNARKVDGIVHPAVAQAFIDSGLQWMECAILFESGFDRLVDLVVYVDAPLEVRIDRVMRRDNIDCAKTLEWMGRQMNPDEARKRSHYVIINDGFSDIDKQLNEIIKHIKTHATDNSIHSRQTRAL